MANDLDIVCDRIRSNVQIYYLMQEDAGAADNTTDDAADLSEEDKQDMYNLLVETIYNQAEVGSFASVGDVASVEIEDDGTDNTDGDNDGTRDGGDSLNDVPDPSGGSTTFQDKKGPILAAAAGFAALFAGGYWYAQGEDPEEGDGEDKNEQTDESDGEGGVVGGAHQ